MKEILSFLNIFMSIKVKFMSIIGKFEKQNRVTFWELLKSIIGKKKKHNRLRPTNGSHYRDSQYTVAVNKKLTFHFRSTIVVRCALYKRYGNHVV